MPYNLLLVICMKWHPWATIVIALLLSACISDLYRKPSPVLGEDIANLSEAYVKATRGGILDFTAVIPGKVYHPKDGYIHYERLWCLDETKGSLDEYQQIVDQLCHLKGGAMVGTWCAATSNALPLFSASIEQNGTVCTGGDPTTIVITYEPISSATSTEWRLAAEALGYRKAPK